MHIRRATLEDVEALGRLKSPGLSDRCLARDERQRSRFALVGEGLAAYVLAVRNLEVIGHVFLRFAGTSSAPEYPDIDDLYVRKDCRGQGVGRELIGACESIASEHGFSCIGLSVNPTLNEQARRLYERLGYRDVGRPIHLDGVYAGVEDWCIEMVKPISRSNSPSVFSKNE